ncbi:hypothetical protein PPSIR1_37789 [Plesiocystis pacifica SIR-1]|uniref:Lipoprotein n=1 Tax=Plesiocystis pacifica SIR-1 TaxID=391625 RepID=A6GHM3_9BACT|nr:hypothetical protein [Plesiocystis pacifica]EDM74647.1 hypothetical protein PPSIR1_37789 [Plesiocystis pacifica SIR-1]
MHRARSNSTGFALALALALATTSVACVEETETTLGGEEEAPADDTGADEGLEEAEEESEGEQSDEGDEGSGECVAAMSLDPVIAVSVDGSDTVPTLTASCTPVQFEHDAGTLTLSFDCTDFEGIGHAVVLEAPAAAMPALDMSASHELVLVEDMSGRFGPGPHIRLDDPDGVVLAQIRYASAADWGSLSMGYASFCEADPETGETGNGHVRVSVSGGESVHQVYVGEPAVVAAETGEWDVHALDATDVCCHGATIDVAIVRR